MGSAADKKKKEAKEKARLAKMAARKGDGATDSVPPSTAAESEPSASEAGDSAVPGTPGLTRGGSSASLAAAAERAERAASKAEAQRSAKEAMEASRTVSGVRTALPDSRDIQFDQVTLLFHGHEILQDATINLNHGRRYGLLGPNGCGKSTLLACLGRRELEIQDHIDIYYMDREMPASDATALEAVVSADAERERLEREADELGAAEEMTPEIEERLERVWRRLDDLGAETAEARAGQILAGLGFSKAMQAKRTRDFSGGWRMRIALARALFLNPTLLILDEPTNHLDLEACVWLEDRLAKNDQILLFTSHSADFLNAVCTNIIDLKQKRLKYYTGNYDSYVQTKAEEEENQMKKYKWEQEQIRDMKEYIARFGHGSAKLARQAQSKEKVLAKMVAEGLTERPETERAIRIRFKEAGKLPPPVLQFTNVSFGYPGAKELYRNLELGVDSDSRVALVGPNGAGKSTLLKLMTGQNEPTEGRVQRHNHLKLGEYHQHLTERLDLSLSALDWMAREFGGQAADMRAVVGRFGISGRNQSVTMAQLSDGLRCRVALAWLAHREPNVLLLDEPTNHLDLETIDALADGINAWDGGVVLVSHDFRLIGQVAKEIWIVDHGVAKWDGDIQSFKRHLKKRMEDERAAGGGTGVAAGVER